MQALSKHSSTLVFMIVLGIHCNFLIDLPICLKTCRSNFFFFLQGKMCAPEKSGASQRFCAPICPGLETTYCDTFILKFLKKYLLVSKGDAINNEIRKCLTLLPMLMVRWCFGLFVSAKLSTKLESSFSIIF